MLPKNIYGSEKKKLNEEPIKLLEELVKVEFLFYCC